MHKLKEDISLLTTIPVPALARLEEKAAICICDSVEEAVLGGQNIADIDVGIGNLQVLVDGNELRYRFIPNKKFDAAVRRTVIEKSSPLTKTVEATLAKRITNIYKNYV